MKKKYKTSGVTFFTLFNCDSGAVLSFSHFDSHRNDHVFLHLKQDIFYPTFDVILYTVFSRQFINITGA